MRVIILQLFILRQEIQHHKIVSLHCKQKRWSNRFLDHTNPFSFQVNLVYYPANHTRILCNNFIFAIHCCSEYFRLLMRYPFWVSNSTEAENCTKKQTNEQINLLLENSKFLQLQSCKIFVSKLCIRSKNTIMVIINDVFSPKCICTYQEKKSYLYALQF